MKRREGGFASLVTIVVVLLIVLWLMRAQLGSLLPKRPDAPERTAIDAAKERAAEVEDLQRRRLEQAEDLGTP